MGGVAHTAPPSWHPLDFGRLAHQKVLVQLGYAAQVVPQGFDAGQFAPLGRSHQPEVARHIHHIGQHRHQAGLGEDDQTRSFSSRFEKVHKVKPNQVHAGVYSSVLHYLKSVAAAKSDAAPAVAAKMRELPIKDDVMRNASIRPDGRVVHDMLLVEVKKPAQSKAAWDYYNILGTIPANTAFMPLAQSQCSLVKK